MNRPERSPCGAVVLCGGTSRRMGRPKALLPFGREPLLARIVRLVAEVAAPVVVSAAAQQQLPALPAEVLVVRDRHGDRGPVEGLCLGLGALAAQVPRAFVTSCDVPLLVPACVQRIMELAEGHELAIPRGERFEPLSGVYSTALVPRIQALADAGQRRLTAIVDELGAWPIALDLLRPLDPRLGTLRNLNFPDDYLAALREAGLAPPE